MTIQTFDIVLPAGYRPQDALAFHGRDAEGVAERVDRASIRKGVLLDGVAVELRIALDAGRARCSIDMASDMASDTASDAAAKNHDGAVPAQARAALRNMLGLRIDPAPFEAAVRDDPLFGPVVRRTPGLRGSSRPPCSRR